MSHCTLAVLMFLQMRGLMRFHRITDSIVISEFVRVAVRARGVARIECHDVNWPCREVHRAVKRTALRNRALNAAAVGRFAGRRTEKRNAIAGRRN